MNEKEFQKLVKKDKYQVFLFTSSIRCPLTFIQHCWFITVNKNQISRWEVWEFKNKNISCWDHVHLNLFKPYEGIPKFYGIKSKFNSKLLSMIEGSKDSLAKKMVEFIENNSPKYIYTNKYRYFPGPNSNTYVQWIINKFPESNFKLPKTALGKNFKIKEINI